MCYRCLASSGLVLYSDLQANFICENTNKILLQLGLHRNTLPQQQQRDMGDGLVGKALALQKFKV